MKLLLLLTTLLALATLQAADAPAKPNILLIYSDDHGWADLGIQGVDNDVRTPNLDQLARDGVWFSRGYVSAPQCVPSRAGVLTGRYQQRFGVEDNGKGPLPLSELTIAERLKSAGYTSGWVGKSHLDVGGGNGEQRSSRILLDHLPHRHGFEEYFRGQMRDYYASHSLDGKPLPDAPRLVRDNRFRVAVQTEAALSFLHRRAARPEQPWFLYLAWYAPHVPLESPEPWFSGTPESLPLKRRQALAMIAAMDDGLGQIRSRLKAMGQERNTLIVFIGDNGAPLGKGWNGSINLPMAGEKGMLADGGIRVPFIAAWPGTWPAGVTYDQPVMSLDFAATAVAAAGLPHDARLDGVNLTPFVTGENKSMPHERLFWRWGSQAAVLEMPYKLVKLGSRPSLLFDVTHIDGEQIGRNIASQHPEIVARLERRLNTWAAELQSPGLSTDNSGYSRYHEEWFAEPHQAAALDLRAADEDSPARREPVRLILETDMSGDCDDAGSLALLHALADRGECALLAVLTNRKDESNASAAAADAINTYYARPDIPIGTDKQGPTALQRTSPYAAALRDEFPNDVGPDDRAPDALEVYRRVLPAQPDGSVTICSVGALSNLAELCRREPELVRTKVLRLVVMGGEFPAKTVPEVNIMTHKEAAQIVVAEWPGEIVWHGFEVGNAIITGAQLKQTPRSNPVRRAYELRQYKKRPSIEGGQPSYDQAAALFAVRGAEPEFWEVVKPGRVSVDPEGLIQWQADPAGRHSYVKIVGAPQRLAAVIEALMIAPPTCVHAQNTNVPQPAVAPSVADRGATEITAQAAPNALIPPYPPSDFIESLTIDARRVSIGDGDNWANTWGDDDRMYSFFADGRGFDRKKSVSCAPVIIEGHPPQISGRDLVSPTGTIPDPSGKNSRKVCGLLMADGVLYAWVRNLNLPGTPKGTGAGMMVSADRGRTWERVDWNWAELGYPVWLNAGRNYQAARDDYAYYLSPDGPSAYADYPHLVLGRVPVASIRDRAAHEFFAGFASPGVPRWDRFESRKPVFTDPNGCFRPNLVYNPGLKRYFLVMSSPYGKWKWWATDNPNRRAHLGIFDAPTPWGPWSVVDYIADWGAPENRFAPNIPSKWISDDGTTFYLLYSCIPNGPYQFNVQRCTVKLKVP